MKIGLIDVDSHHFPNLCLMKLSAYHKARGDDVEWHRESNRYDVVYQSRVFTDEYTKDPARAIHAERIIRGGTGYGLLNRLPKEVEHTFPDYSLYPQFPDTAYGFLSRGCPRGCGFCIVSEKEGRTSVRVADLASFWNGQRLIKLLDPNLLACAEHEALLVQLADSRAYVDFTQGLDIRLVTRENVGLLNRVKTKALHFAWNNPAVDLSGAFRQFADWTTFRNQRSRVVYVLCNYGSTHEQDLYRIDTLRSLGFAPYVMIYNKPSAPLLTRQLQRWVNARPNFYSVPDFKEYLNHFKKGE